MFCNLFTFVCSIVNFIFFVSCLSILVTIYTLTIYNTDKCICSVWRMSFIITLCGIVWYCSHKNLFSCYELKTSNQSWSITILKVYRGVQLLYLRNLLRMRWLTLGNNLLWRCQKTCHPAILLVIDGVISPNTDYRTNSLLCNVKETHFFALQTWVM